MKPKKITWHAPKLTIISTGSITGGLTKIINIGTAESAYHCGMGPCTFGSNSVRGHVMGSMTSHYSSPVMLMTSDMLDLLSVGPS